MSGILSKKILEDVRFRNDITDVIGSYVEVKKAGSSFKACCPFHKEKTPSFHINQQRQSYHCFGCGVGGDVFNFVMQIEGVDFMGAVRLLAHKAGVELEFDDDGGEGSKKPLLYKMTGEIAALYCKALRTRDSAQIARDYLKSRQLSDETVEKFMIGYSPDLWDAVLKWSAKKYSIEDVESAGFIIKSSKPGASDRYYDRFRNRLMFPVRDQQGRVIAFSARALSDEDKGAKYINSPETPLFNKGRVLYALDLARRHIVDRNEALICEGQIDVIRCHQAGFEHAVASQGTAFTEDQVKILSRYADSVMIVFDQDTAGQNAAMKTAASFINAGMAVRIAVLPDGEDPDSFITEKGSEAFGKILDSALSAMGFVIQALSARQDVSSEIGLMRIAKAAVKLASHSPSAVQRAALLQEGADILGLPVDALNQELDMFLSKSRHPSPANSEPPAPVQITAKRQDDEVMLCEHLMREESPAELLTLIARYLPLSILKDPVARKLLAAIIRSCETGCSVNEAVEEVEPESGEVHQLMAYSASSPSKLIGKEFSRVDALKGIILRIWSKHLLAERNSLGGEDTARRMQITYDLKSLKSWDTGALIIELEVDDLKSAL